MEQEVITDGTFIVLEGADGSGKTTQFKLLAERLRAVGYKTEIFDFPRYRKPSSHFIKQYLNGHYGPATSVSPYVASIFYALDRYEAAPEIIKALSSGKIVLSNRYVGSNMAHQGAKISDSAEQRGFFIWNEGLEYNLLRIPRPTINLFLHVPAELSFQLVSRKQARDYTNRSHDEHEADIHHLRSAVGAYEVLSRLFPKDYVKIECMEDGRLLGITQISDLIWQTVKPILPPNPPNKGKKLIINIESLTGGRSKNTSPKRPQAAKSEVRHQKKAPLSDKKNKKRD